MASQALITKKRPNKKGAALQRKGSPQYETRQDWPIDYEAAYRRDYQGPYTASNAWLLLSEEPLELFNGWLVWQEMTNSEERRIAAIIQEILSMAARLVGFGQAYPDQFECVMANGDTHKPDVCLISDERFEKQVKPVNPESDHVVLFGSPELVVEIRSRSNRRTEEHRKRQRYFESGAVVIWDVDYKTQTIYVYEATNPDIAHKFTAGDEINCEPLLPGWTRKVSDFFTKGLNAEEIAGQAAVQWRAESELKASINMVLSLASSRFGEAQLPTDLSERLERYNVVQLTELAKNIISSPALDKWLASFPD